nr:helix-turn-helix domain-containing protein [Enterococcus cecorum]
MLDNLLKSKVRNKVLIFIILFNNNVLHLDKMSTYLNISDVYLKDLVTELNQLLQGKARIQFQKDKHLKLIMAKNVNYLEILHQIYGESIILKYFAFLINNHEQLPFSAFIEKKLPLHCKRLSY